jgi:hypothetical protein
MAYKLEINTLFKASNLDEFDKSFNYGWHNDIHDVTTNGDNVLNTIAASFKSFEDFKTCLHKYPFTDDDIKTAIGIYLIEEKIEHIAILDNYYQNIQYLINYYKLKNL